MVCCKTKGLRGQQNLMLEYNNLMSQYQQNKQSEQAKRTGNRKFLSVKSVIRNKKIIVKKTVPANTFHPQNQNIFSTYQLVQNQQLQVKNEPNSYRQLENSKNSSTKNTNVVTIKFGDDRNYAHKLSDQKMRKKFTNNFSIQGQEIKKTFVSKDRDRLQFGFVQESLIIEPLQKVQSHFGWDKRKGFYNYMLITKKQKSKNKQQLIKGHQTMNDFRQFGKQITQLQFPVKTRSNSKQYRTSTSFMPTLPSRIPQQKESKVISEKTEKQTKTLYCQKSMKAISEMEKIDKAKEKQIYQGLLKQYKDILSLRKPSSKKDYFVFGMSEKPVEPQNKIQIYRDFLWKVNYSNGIFAYIPQTFDSNYKAFIGAGNNSCMLKSILRRRTWWTIIQQNSSIESCHFVWTQLKINSFFKGQQNHMALDMYEDIDNAWEQIKNESNSMQQFENRISHSKIFNNRDLLNWQMHMKRHGKYEDKITDQTHLKRLKLFSKKKINKILDSQKIKIHNHLEFNYFLGNKKALFYNIKRWCEMKNQNPFQYIPVTFHITKGMEDPVFQAFFTYFQKLEDLKKVDKNFRNLWICKPGENTNRGNGISVCGGLDDIRHRLRGKQRNSDGKPRTFILQKYIQKPLLYKNRKFDIRHYMLLSCFNGNLKAYWFDQGYIRTSSTIFNLKNSNDIMIHLTNDAVQKKSEGYGKYEKGNKVSYEDFQKYLDANFKRKHDFLGKILQKMKKIALNAVEATYFLLDPNKKQHNFELIGLDFMIDQNFKPWLIEANTNPCLQLSSPLLQKLIPTVIQHTFRLCVDPFFPPPENCLIKNKFFGQNALIENRFELIFDESVDGERIQKIMKSKQKQEKMKQFNQLIGKVEQDNELFQDDGNDNWQEKNTNN